MSVQKAQAWLDCILLPPGLHGDWNVNITTPGIMKIDKKLHLVTCYWNFLMQTLEIDPAFRLFFRMFGHDIAQLTSLSIKKDQVLQLQNCILEMVGTWEGMLPPKTMRQQLHQIVDLSHQINYFGPLIACNELPGERFLGQMIQLRLEANNGGRESYLKTVMEKQILNEEKTMRQYNSLPSTDHSMLSYNYQYQRIVYNELPFSISNEYMTNQEYATITHFELEMLIDTLLKEILKVHSSTTNRQRESLIYRIFYDNNKNRLPRHQWINKLKNIVSTGSNQTVDNDFTMAEKFLNFKPRFHKNACIYGVDFSSRGSDCREIRNADSENPSNANCKWFEKRETQSWCQFDNYIPGNLEVIPYYGYLNSFFDVDYLGDPALKGLLVASVTPFAFTTSLCNVDRVERKNSFHGDTLFVALQDIAPTLIGTIPFSRDSIGQNHKAISLNPKVSKFKMHNTIEYSHNAKIEPDYYEMFLLHPNRLSSRPDVSNRDFTKFMF
jgi:hypothetical protein